MKKIISLLSVIAVMFSMITTVAFAADNEVVFTEKNKTANSVDIDLSVTTTYADIQSIAMFLDMDEVLGKGATVTVTSAAATLKYVAANKMVSVAFAPTDGSLYTSGTVLGTISLTGISDDFSIALKPKTARTTTKITSKASGVLTETGVFDTAAIGTSVTMKTEETYGTPITEGTYKDKTLYFDTKTMTFVFGTHKGVLIKKGSEEKKFGLKFFEDQGVEATPGSSMTFTAGVIDENGAAKGTYEFSLINE